jgi:hypothetical protein
MSCGPGPRLLGEASFGAVVSRGPEPRLFVEGSFGAATCSTTSGGGP